MHGPLRAQVWRSSEESKVRPWLSVWTCLEHAEVVGSGVGSHVDSSSLKVDDSLQGGTSIYNAPVGSVDKI